MSRNVADFPTAVWDGLSDNRLSLLVDKKPDFEDWDQMTAEVIAVQNELNSLKYITLTNASGGTLIAGAPVYELANGTGCGKADANGATVLSQIVGLLKAASLTTEPAYAVKQGKLTLTTAQWDAVAGTTGGLAAGVEYYLSGTAERITATRPATTGDHIVSVGIALSSTVLDVNIKYRGVSA